MVRDFDQSLYDPKARDGAKVIIEKQEQTKAIVTVADVPVFQSQLIEDIPGTRIHFASMANSTFIADINFQDMLEDVELQKAQAISQNHEWTWIEERAAYISYCDMNSRVNRDVAAKKSPTQRQLIVNLLGTVNSETQENWTPEEIADYRNLSLRTVQDIIAMEQAKRVTTEKAAGISAPVVPRPAMPSGENAVPSLPDPDAPTVLAVIGTPNPDTGAPYTVEEARAKVARILSRLEPRGGNGGSPAPPAEAPPQVSA
jgi:hypothetical protein